MDPLELLTLVLILVTGFYAWQTRRTVVEMKRSREAQMLPKLALELQPKYGAIATLDITDVGPGPAIDLDLELSFEPAPGSDAPPQVKKWRAPALVHGQRQNFMPTAPIALEEGAEKKMRPVVLAQLGQAYESVTLRGTMKDALGNRHDVHEGIDNLEAIAAAITERGWTADPIENAIEKIDHRLLMIERALMDVANVGRAMDSYRSPYLRRSSAEGSQPGVGQDQADAA
jgi:hypothetical protein